MPPMDMGAHQRAFTPPIVPPSKVMSGAAAATSAASKGPQVLAVAGGSMMQGGEEMVDLVFDPILNCYYDAKTNQYFELKH